MGDFNAIEPDFGWSFIDSTLYARNVSVTIVIWKVFGEIMNTMGMKYHLSRRREFLILYKRIKCACTFPLRAEIRVPTRTGKPGKMGRHFPVREKSGNFEQTGKVRENHTKYWKIEIN